MFHMSRQNKGCILSTTTCSFAKSASEWQKVTFRISNKPQVFQRHCVVSLSKNINPTLVLVQPRKTRPFITERLLMGRKESNQTKQVFASQILFEELLP